VGERLVQTLGPRFEEIEAELAALGELCDKPAGNVRITATEYAADAILLPKLAKLLRDYPDIRVEITVDYGLTDIVSQRYDAGVRSGEQVGKDMIAVRIGPGEGVRGRVVAQCTATGLIALCRDRRGIAYRRPCLPAPMSGIRRTQESPRRSD
jgi:DNA-binding transcriptional LysR family regulator